MLVVGTEGEVDIVTGIDGLSSLQHRLSLSSPLFFLLFYRQLVNGRIVAHHHAIEAQIVAQDVLQNGTIGYAGHCFACHGMIARHDGPAARQTYHGLVGHQDLLHQFLLISIAATTVAQVVLGAGADTLAQVALLQATHKRHTHRCRQVTILAIRLLETVKRGCAAHIDHR